MDDIRIGLRTKEEYAESITISYVPSILSLTKRKEITLQSEKITFKEVKVESDSVIPSLLTSEGTEINHAKVSSTSRVFNAYGKGICLTKSNYRNAGMNVQSFHDQVIRELSMQFDGIGLLSEGGNNALIVSSDPNYVTLSSAEIPAVSGDGFNQVLKAKEIAVNLNSLVNDYTASINLNIYFYGPLLTRFLGNITSGQENDVQYHVRQAFVGKNVRFINISALALGGLTENGIIVASDDLTTLEHCGLPQIERQGVNDEKNYYWANYFFGSVNVRPETKGAIIKQVITFA